MFNKLRNRLIISNVIVTAIVLLLSFSAIYLAAVGATKERAGRPEDIPTFELMNQDGDIEIIDSNILNRVYAERLEEERSKSLQSLLITLIIAGAAVELIVVIFSYIWADEAIRPVRRAYESQKIFIANASHEIKTPLAIIEANLEAADIQGNRWIENVRTEVQSLAKMNLDLLALARADLAQEKELKTVKIKDGIKELVELFEPKLKPDQKIKIECKSDEEITINQADFVQIARILLDNAVKYAESEIVVGFKGREFYVSNDGAEISDQQKERIFDRFYQTDKSADGVGLGLAIAKTLAERNRWTISVSNRKLTKIILKI